MDKEQRDVTAKSPSTLKCTRCGRQAPQKDMKKYREHILCPACVSDLKSKRKMKSKCPNCGSVQDNIPRVYEGNQIKCLDCGEMFLAKKYDGAENKVQQSDIIKVESVEATPVVLPKTKRPVKTVKRKVLFAALSVAVGLVTIGSWYGFKRGWKKGYGKGYDNAVEVMRVLSEAFAEAENSHINTSNPPRSASPSYTYQPATRPDVSDFFKLIRVTAKPINKPYDQSIGWAELTWMVELECYFQGSVDVKVEFLDSEGFVLDTAHKFKAPVQNGVNKISGRIPMESTVAAEVVKIEAVVKVNMD